MTFRPIAGGLLLLSCLTSLVGCATVGTSPHTYAEPTQRPAIENSIVLAEPFDAVWDRLVGRLATGFFVINNIDKASRLINVSFSSDSPQQYIDCGTTTRHFSTKQETQTYKYLVAEDSTFKHATAWGPYKNLQAIAVMTRNTSLEGRINVYVAPTLLSETKVSVNTKYVFTASVSGIATGYNAFGQVAQQERVPESSSSADFTTAERKVKNWATDGTVENITCQATGELERTLLSMARATVN